MIAILLSIALTGATLDVGDKPADMPRRYTPEIRGRLLDGTKPVSSNVCLRQSGSEIRMCGYTDFSGNFYIPTHSAQPKPGDTEAPSWWLEIGRVTEAHRIAPVQATQERSASIVLECNLARRSKADSTICDRKSTVAAATAQTSGTESRRSPKSGHPAK